MRSFFSLSESVSSLLALGLGTIGYILATQYHPTLELRDALIVLYTDTTSISM